MKVEIGICMVFRLKLHIDSAQNPGEANKQDEDFFAECENDNNREFSLSNNNYEPSSAVNKVSFVIYKIGGSWIEVFFNLVDELITLTMLLLSFMKMG